MAAHRETIRLNPDDYLGYHNLGKALGLQGKSEEAAAASREAIRLKPDFYPAYNNLGAALTLQGKLDMAIAAYRDALRFKPESPRFTTISASPWPGRASRATPSPHTREPSSSTRQREVLQRPRLAHG